MAKATLEHLHITVEKPVELAQTLCELFDWEIRWQDKASDDDTEYLHVGSDTTYLSLYRPPQLSGEPVPAYSAANTLNHIGIVVDDIATTRERILAAGLTIADENAIAPGQRIYFYIQNLEFEAVMY